MSHEQETILVTEVVVEGGARGEAGHGEGGAERGEGEQGDEHEAERVERDRNAWPGDASRWVSD